MALYMNYAKYFMLREPLEKKQKTKKIGGGGRGSIIKKERDKRTREREGEGERKEGRERGNDRER